jgi:hypothetical protein
MKIINNFIRNIKVKKLTEQLPEQLRGREVLWLHLMHHAEIILRALGEIDTPWDRTHHCSDLKRLPNNLYDLLLVPNDIINELKIIDFNIEVELKKVNAQVHFEKIRAKMQQGDNETEVMNDMIKMFKSHCFRVIDDSLRSRLYKLHDLKELTFSEDQQEVMIAWQEKMKELLL